MPTTLLALIDRPWEFVLVMLLGLACEGLANAFPAILHSPEMWVLSTIVCELAAMKLGALALILRSYPKRGLMDALQLRRLAIPGTIAAIVVSTLAVILVPARLVVPSGDDQGSMRRAWRMSLNSR